MKRITIVATLAVALGVGAAVATASRASTAAPTMGEKNVVQAAIAAGQFKTLASLLRNPDLAGTLEGNGSFFVTPNVAASNGVIHVINKVLIP